MQCQIRLFTCSWDLRQLDFTKCPTYISVDKTSYISAAKTTYISVDKTNYIYVAKTTYISVVKTTYTSAAKTTYISVAKTMFVISTFVYAESPGDTSVLLVQTL